MIYVRKYFSLNKLTFNTQFTNRTFCVLESLIFQIFRESYNLNYQKDDKKK